jgi:hypothetical protein
MPKSKIHKCNVLGNLFYKSRKLRAGMGTKNPPKRSINILIASKKQNNFATIVVLHLLYSPFYVAL